MLTLYHSPQSRSSRVVWLLEELGAVYDLKQVSIRRMMSGTGEPDPANPHPDKKVPFLTHDGAMLTESTAIFLYLTDLHPEAGLGPKVGDAGRGAYLNWLAYYSGVVEQVIFNKFAGFADNPAMQGNYRGMDEYFARFSAGLGGKAYLLGDNFSAVDLLFASMGEWMREGLPPGEEVDAWLARCFDRPARARAQEKDGAP